MSLRIKLAKPLNNVLRPLQMQLVPGRSPDPAVRQYILARKMLAAARKAGMSVGAYIDHTFARPGATQETVRAMLQTADLLGGCDRVCEIGPGSGRYAEEVTAALHPRAYEIYETARDWLPHLRRLPNVVVRDCDGHTLAQTRDASMDLVHAHKVFVYLEFYATAGYLSEMARVARPGGTVAFDIVTEDCLDDQTVGKWARDGTIFRPVPRAWVIEFLHRHDLTLRGSHIAPLQHGTTELLVFRRN